MALQVWLPLNGDLENKGSSNIIITNNGATIDDNGKIGKCYSFNSTNIKYVWNNINDLNEMSGSCWVYLTNLSGCQYFFFLGGQGSHLSKLSLEYDAGYLRSHANGSQYNSGLTLTTNIWYHITVTVKNNIIIWYINGEKKKELSISGTFNASNICTLGCRTNNAAGTSYAYYITNNGKLNDVRIYDHCLSAKEVHEI